MMKNRVNELAKEHGYSNLHQVARAADVVPNNLYALAKGKTKRISFELMAALMRVFDVGLDEIFYLGTNSNPTADSPNEDAGGDCN